MRTTIVLAVLLYRSILSSASAHSSATPDEVCPESKSPPPSPSCPTLATFVRIATFNISFFRFNEGDLKTELATAESEQAQSIAKVIQHIRPDVVLLNEFDFDEAGEGVMNFLTNYLEVSFDGSKPISYEYSYVAPSNTGVPSGYDYDNDGSSTGPGDSYGFGFFPGQYGMALLSKYPIDFESIRTFQTFLYVPCSQLVLNC